MSSLFRNTSKPQATPTTVGSIAGDVALPSDATDTISALRWSPVANHLAAASWDGKTRIYDVQASGNAQGVAVLNAEGPIFDCDWSKDGTMVTAAGADKKVHILQASTGQTVNFVAHDAPIRAVRFVDIPASGAPIVASGSWDKTVRYWDLRQTTQPLATLTCSERVYSMDTAERLLVIACADLNIHLVDLHSNPAAFVRTVPSQLKFQTRVVTTTPDGKYWATGGIEGRCGASAVDEIPGKDYNFTWRCHREEPDAKKITKIWAVNDASYHPRHPGTLATAGSDGTFCFWDIPAHQRLKAFPNVGGAITAAAFSRGNGAYFAYAVGYDWSMGYAHNTPQYPIKLMLHAVEEAEVNKAAKK